MRDQNAINTAYLEPSHVRKGQWYSIHHKSYLNHEDYVCKPHFHNVHELIFFEQVGGVFHHPNGSSTLLPLDMVFTPAMESHNFSLTTHAKAWYVLQFENDMLPTHSLSTSKQSLEASHLRLNQTDCNQVFQCVEWLLAGFLSVPDNIEIKTLCQHVLTLTFSRALRQEATHSVQCRKIERLTAILERLNNNDMDYLNLNQAADLCYLSPAYFSRQFKQTMGTTYTDYIATHRLKQAGRLLTQTNQSVTDVSFSLGFSSPSYFIKQFKRYFHITPKQFKQRHL